MSDETATPVTPAPEPSPAAISGAFDDKLRFYLAMAVLAGFLAFVLGLVVTHDLDASLKGAIVGYFAGWISSPFGFYFGSSSGSKVKTMQGAKP